jgi:hypothetical protein
MATAGTQDRPRLIRRARRLEYFTVVWNSLEALVSISAGLIAGSVALVGFGLDSVIEVASGMALLWRLHHDLDPSRREELERTTVRIVGWCFLALALYVLYESGSTLIRHEAPETSILGFPLISIPLRRSKSSFFAGKQRIRNRSASEVGPVRSTGSLRPAGPNFVPWFADPLSICARIAGRYCMWILWRAPEPNFSGAVCDLDLKGIVAKRKDGLYTPEATTWVKIRNLYYNQMEDGANCSKSVGLWRNRFAGRLSRPRNSRH